MLWLSIRIVSAMEILPLFIVLKPTPDFPRFYYMLGANLGLLMYGDVSLMNSHWSVIEHRTRKQDIELGNYTAQSLENMADLHGES